jgi:two-component system, sensor histidine kinase and response regulator
MEPRSNIMVVDDEVGPRESLKQILKPYYNVITVERPTDAIAMLDHVPIDLVTLDLKMPGLSGTKVLEKIKQHDADIEAIIITGYGSMDTAIEGLRLGAFDYISKPFDVNHILTLIRRALQRRQAKMELKNVKSEFLANISHELRTPLSVVIGFVSILLDQLLGQLSDQQQKILERVYKNSGELLELVDNVLLLSSLNAGELTLMNEAFDARVMLDDCLKRYESLVNDKNITVRTEAPAKLSALGDRGKSARIVQNLLHNAIKFTPEGGSITLRLGEVREAGMIEFEIIDTGMGMPEQQIERLFQPFQQMDSSIRRQFSGLGLGLTVARRLTDFLGGNLQIKSRRDTGTHVTLTIPQDHAPENLVARHTV